MAIHDPLPPHLAFEGVRYGFLESIFPGLRRVRLDAAGRLTIRGLLRPGESVQFRTRYRAEALPPRSDVSESE